MASLLLPKVTSNTAPAHPHATGVAVYPALFFQMEVKFSREDMQLAIVQFGRHVYQELTFQESTYLDYDSLVGHVDRIKKVEGGETNTARALNVAKNILDGGR